MRDSETIGRNLVTGKSKNGETVVEGRGMDKVPDRGSPSRSTSEPKGSCFADRRFESLGMSPLTPTHPLNSGAFRECGWYPAAFRLENTLSPDTPFHL